jgi:hypothetical protein
MGDDPTRPAERQSVQFSCRRGALVQTLAAVTAVVPTVLACSSGSGDATVSVAEARVTAKEAALTAAKAEATAASATFCAATKTYVTALDRYGDVLNATRRRWAT